MGAQTLDRVDILIYMEVVEQATIQSSLCRATMTDGVTALPQSSPGYLQLRYDDHQNRNFTHSAE